MVAIKKRGNTNYNSVEYIKGMHKYLASLKRATGEQAIKEAREGLIRTGVADKDGHIKKKIVSWE